MKTIHELIEAQARRTPDAIALEFDGTQLTYREMDLRANRLANALRRRGAGPETVVAFAAQRSLDLVVGLIGILKSGAAYLPLDLELPTDRLSYMTESAGAVALLRGPGMDRDLGLPGLTELTTADTADEPDVLEPAVLSDRNTAYVMFTSGSTGLPKGVVVEHRGVVNRLRWGQNEYGMTPDERVVQKTPYAFDVSVYELFWPLIAGARLVIARPGGHRDSRYLLDLIRSREITTVHFIPTMLAMFTGEPGVERCHSLRRVMTSGEALPVDLAERLMRLLPDVDLHNLYGPTEASIEVSAWHCEPGWTGPRVPIGSAVANTQLHILDDELRPAERSGELYLAGVQLARGYLGRPGLTADRFRPDPYGEPGTRMYASGDLSAWHSPGVVDCLGRVDEQLKLGGNRVEPGEIQAVLGEQPGVRAAVVVAAGSAAEVRLIAYVVGAGLDLNELRDRLADRLPSYMIPSTFVALDELPLTPNGKLDRKALPAPQRPEIATAYRAPQTPAQERIAAVYASVLGIGAVGIDDTFFELGGHSLLAVRLIARLREEVGVDLTVRELFDGLTVETLATRAAPVAAAAEVVEGAGPRTSSGQDRLLFLQHLEPDSPAYVIPVAWRIEGRLDETGLRRALERLAARHDALRTRFPVVAGQVEPVVEETPAVDLRRADHDEWTGELATDELRRPFALAAGPLWRAVLFRLPEHDVLLLVLHHVVADGWSLGLIAQELGNLYAGVLTPAPASSYQDFVAWQRAELTPEREERELAHWRGVLGGVPALELPTDRQRPTVLGSAGATHRFELPADVVPALTRIAQEHATTVHTVLLAAFQVLLGRWSGQQDFAIGTPAAGRSRPETEDVVGFFVNTLAIRADLTGNPARGELIDRVREAVLTAQEHQDLPFERVVEDLRPVRDASRTPVFQAMFALRDTGETALRLPGTTVTEVPVGWRTAKCDLTLFIDRGPDGTLSGLFEYATDLFDDSTVERLADGFRRLLDGEEALGAGDRDRLLSLGTADRPRLPELCLHQLVTGDGPAIVDGERVWSYAGMLERAHRLAAHLRGLGVGPETVVAVSLPRSAELVVAQLAVLEAGGAYLPLDTAQPAARTRIMMTDCNADLLITVEGRADGCRIVDPTAEYPAAAAFDAGVHPDNLAYIVYTSGSTGRPKGIGITHRAAVRTVREGGYADLGPGDRVAFAANPVFDAAAFELWAPLVAGATVVVTPPDVVLSPAALTAHLARHGITTLFLTTALFNQVVRERPDAFDSLRHVLFGGEAADPTAVNAIAHRARAGALLHMYGPSEAATFATWQPVTDPAAQEPSEQPVTDPAAQEPSERPVTDHVARVPIGRPLANTTAYVVDDQLRLVPEGVTGELLLGGPGLARGYLGAAARTASSFVPDPFGEPGGRLYRTGDLVRWNRTGALEFIGRADGQVKIRGFRVELGEIEAAIRRHPAVRDAVVVARPDRAGTLSLAAYAIADQEPGDLRGFVAQQLPAYMVPATVQILAALPITANGKVDRAALPEPTPTPTKNRRAPGTPMEHAVAEVWADVLGIPEPGTDDDFFDLGGHSLLAIRVVSAIAARTGREISFRDLFATRTVAALARLLDDASPVTGEIVRGTATTGLPVTSGQARLVFLDRLEDAGAAYIIPVAWHLTGPLDPARLATALDILVARHDALRTRFTLTDGEVRQDLEPGWTGLTRHTAPTLAEAVQAAENAARTPFDLTAGNLFRAVLWQVRDDEHVLLLAMHHSVADGWSLGVLINDLQALYGGADLPAPPVRYADYAAWQAGELTGDRATADLDYWRDRLAALPDLELPADHPRPARRTGEGGTCEFTVAPEVAAGLEKLGREHGATLYMTLLAGFQALLGRWTGQDDFGVGTPVAGRGRAEIRDVVGFFLDTLVMRADLGGDPAFGELLDRVRDRALDAYRHQAVPFGKLVEALHPDRDLARSPLFQTMFTFNDWTLGELDLGSATGPAVPLDRRAAKLDLTLEMVHGPDGLAGSLDYSTDILDTATAERMAGAYRQLLAVIVDHPATRLGDLFPSAVTASPPRQSTLLLDTLTEQVRLTPHATAVIAADATLTYAELDGRANQLGHYLLAHGAGPECRVGLRLPRGADTLVAVLGIWKAGAAFVALDPDLPARRIAELREDSDAQLLVTPRTMTSLEGYAQSAPTVDIRPDHLAYVTYTSGSTGRPKGVLTDFGNVAAYLETILKHYRLGGADVVLQRATPSFDAFLRDCVGPLTVGATVLMAEQSDLSTLGTDLAGRPAPTAILSIVPSLLHHLLDGGDLTAGQLPGLRLLTVSGEACTPGLLTKLHRALPGLRRVVNQYGPTEATITTTVHDLDPAAEHDRVPIGRPMPGTTVQILDRGMRPVPAGVFGEIFIGGAGVARGYQNRPGATAASFVPAPDGTRLYRTGDAARCLADGTLEFRGRLDRQVKVRGVRVEPAEVEAALAACPGVGGAAVLARPDGAGGWKLAGYAQAGPGLTTAALRAHLEERLPHAMVPADLLVAPELPLLGNGKVDRAALPEIAAAAPAREYVAPRTTTEKVLAEVWEDLLDRGDLGVDDDFFALGGHSLTALRVISRLRDRIGVRLTLRAFFEARTIARLARKLEEIA
ncbi:non-ribosomal peptide synthetase [Winogradskya humida]|uniref:Carrier domain-containing protein n=1 Tax=Winogradskya humida TaxID=113566 RepID=A0ABQ4A4G8_9ACTN|nr:non-ribosomal peptide synthetase [Actinoplanes humidus]GIE25644.1 hypothetical protein Ahu01nite_087460 [Actinoplanes humidus]